MVGIRGKALFETIIILLAGKGRLNKIGFTFSAMEFNDPKRKRYLLQSLVFLFYPNTSLQHDLAK